MSITDHEGKFQVEYSQENAFCACKEASELLNGISIQKMDELTHTIYLKAGMTLFSFGEIINVNVSKINDSLSEIFISSAPKIGMGANAPGLMGDMGKNRKNINKIQQAISEQLSKYPKAEQINQTNQISIADEIKKLAELKDSGILTETEFSEKKKQLLNL